MSASANATNGDLPPSSSETGVRLAPADAATSLPVGTEPVNAIRSTSGFATSAAPASSPIPWTTLNAPSGNPASCAMSASIDAVSGAHSGGLTTTVFPAASAGAIRHVASISGAFHGVITTATPDGSHDDVLGEPVEVDVGLAQLQQPVREEPEVPRDARHDGVPHRTQQGPVVPRLDGGQVGNPCLDPVGDRVQHRGAIHRRHAAPDGNALRAAATAAAASSAPPRATSAIGASSIGETSVKVRPTPRGCRRSSARSRPRRPRSWPFRPCSSLPPRDRMRRQVVRERTVWGRASACQDGDRIGGCATTNRRTTVPGPSPHVRGGPRRSAGARGSGPA